MTTINCRNQNPFCCKAGPILSKLIRSLLENDEYLHKILRVIYEVHSVYVDDKCFDAQTSQHRGYKLNVLYRINPLNFIDFAASEIKLQLNYLFDISPFSMKHNLIDIVQKHIEFECKLKKNAKRRNILLSYIEHYVRVIVDGQIGFYAKWGIAMEPHQQNAFIVFDSASWNIKCSLIRDIAHGISINGILMKVNKFQFIEEQLSNPRKFVYLDGLDAQRQTMHTVICSHLLPFIHILCDEYKEEIRLNECKLIIRNCIECCIQNVLVTKQKELQKTEYQIYCREMKQFKQYLLNEAKETKNLFAMRLKETMKEIYTKTASNPLSLTQSAKL